MYAHKESRRASATRQTRDILLQVLHEREPELGNHMKGVAKLARGVGTRLALIAEELDEVVRAAELHDVGKMAIPDEILHKPGPLTDEEWAFVRQHTIDRRADPERRAGADAGRQARARQPRALGRRRLPGRPRGRGDPARRAHRGGLRRLRRDDHVARPYRAAVPVDEAMEELRACAGTQFDPGVVEAFCDDTPRACRCRKPAVSRRAD